LISLKGIAYIGSFRKSIEANIFKFEHIKRIGGTSAGAITAVLFGVGYTVDEAQVLLEELKFDEFLDSHYKEPLLRLKKDINNLSINYLISNIFTLYKIYKRLNKKIHMGIFPGEQFRKWIENKIFVKLGIKNATFKELQYLIEKKELKNSLDLKYLFLTGSNLSTGKCEIFSHLHTPDMIISDAVRISMSIPIIFNPHRIYIKNQYGERVIDTNKQNSLYVDGGLLNNYPISMFDTKRSVNNNGYIENNYINSETLGFRLVSTELKTNYEKSFEILTNNSNDEKFSSYLQMLFNFYWLSEGNSHTEKIKDKERTIYIDTLSMGVLDFNLSFEDKKKLIKSGQDAIESFLQLNRNKKSKVFLFYLFIYQHRYLVISRVKMNKIC
jgi:NTE family protein